MNIKGKEVHLILFFPMIFPYFTLFALFCIFTNTFMETLFYNNGIFLMFLLIIAYIIAFICSIIFLIKNIKLKVDSKKILHINMIIKLIQIPAYLLIFLIGLLCLITIFTMGIIFILIIFNCMAIFLTGLIGLCGIIRGFFEKKLKLKYSVINAILQFIFCIDIISCIVTYRKIKNI